MVNLDVSQREGQVGDLTKHINTLVQYGSTKGPRRCGTGY